MKLTFQLRLPRLVLFLSIILLVSACHTTKRSTVNNKPVKESSDFYKKYSEKLGVELCGKEDKEFIKQITDWLGVPYVYGGESKEGTDCSGFVQTFYKNYNKTVLNRTAADLVKNCDTINKKDLQIGDLVFFKINNTKVSHVGIYLGKDRFIHASSKGVMVNSLTENYYKKYFFAAGRIKVSK